MGVTSPDNIYVHDGSGPASMVQISQTEGASVQAAFSKRERYDFVWANSSERTAQTGMVQGSRGYQVDTKSEYLYDSSNWRLALSHAEFTTSRTIVDNTTTPNTAGDFSIDSSNSTNSTFITPGTSGILVFADPGIYAVSSITNFRNSTDTANTPTTGRTFVELSFVLNASDKQRVSVAVGEDRGSLSLPNLRVTVANQDVYFEVYKTVGGSSMIKTRARVTRIG